MSDSQSSNEKLEVLRKKYDCLDFTESSIDEIVVELQSELLWQVDNDKEYFTLREEFEIRLVAIRKIGLELNKRGGFTLMQTICDSLSYPRVAELTWAGIGTWAG
jgi:hypothetical protein